MLLSAAFLPILAISGLVAWRSAAQVAGHATQVAVVSRGATLARITGVLDGLDHAMSVLSRSDVVLQGGAGCGRYLQTVLALRSHTLSDLGVLAADGRGLCDALHPETPIHLPFAAGMRLDSIPAQAGETGQNPHLALLSARYMVNGVPVMLAACPLLPGGHAPGSAARFLLAAVRLDNLAPGLAMRRDGISAWLLPADGGLIPLGQISPDAVPRPGLVAELRTGEQETGITRSAAGIPYSYASAHLSDDSYQLLIGYRAVHDQKRAHHLLLRWAGEIAALTLLGLLAVTFGANRAIVRPIARLNRSVEAWRRDGVFDPSPLRNAPWELRALAHSFGAATASLTDREMQLRSATVQQDLLMQEIHHRVKNNLQIVASLLNLQAARIRQPEARAEFQSARDRVRALATLHRHLYTHGEVHTINMRSFLKELCGQLFQAMGETEGERISLDIEASELQMSSDQAVPLALIVTEAVSNAVKYAFPTGRSGHVAVRLDATPDRVRLVIHDDGVGIPAGRSETETGTRDGIGIQLIRGFSRQLGATLQVDEGDGTRYEIVVPLRHERQPAEPAETAPA